MAERARGPLDVGGERCVKLPMKSRVITNDIDDRRMRPQGIVQVRQTVGETWSEMQQRHRRTIEHARVSVGRAGDHAFEQAKHAAHSVDAVEGSDKVHFRCAGIGKADVDVVVQE